MTFSLLVTAREGLEMALIVTILLGYLRSVGQKQHFREIWIGVAAAAALSVGACVALKVASKELDGRVQEGFEGFTMLFAVCVLTWMLFWMKRQSAGISRDLRERVDSALSNGSVAALSLLAFSAVGREGLETALFLFAGSTSHGSDIAFLIGGLLGFGIAAGAGVVLYYGGRRLPLKHFFSVSAVLLMILAAGLLTKALADLHEATIIPNLGVRPWDTDQWLPMTSSLGKFLNALVGYDSAPAISQIFLYWAYLALVVTAYLLWPYLGSVKRTVTTAITQVLRI
jgi:high-affinity iron transporter